MKIIKGLLAFLNDGRRLAMWFIKSPLAVAFALCLFFGVFYAFGIAPNEIGGWFKRTAAPAVGRRIDYLKSDAEGMSDLAKKKLAEKGVVLPAAPKKRVRPVEPQAVETTAEIDVPPQQSEEEHQRQVAEALAWAKAMRETAKPADPLADFDASQIVAGTAHVIGADKIKVNGQTLKLAVKVRAGKAAEAFQALKQAADSAAVRCLLPADEARCFRNNKDITDVLRDRLLVD